MLFYNDNQYGWMILGYTVFSSLLYNVYLILTSILQSLNKFKLVYIVSILGFLVNGLLDIPLMYLFNYLGVEAFYGAITSSIIGYSLSLGIGLIVLHKKENIHYNGALKIICKDLIPGIAMVIVLAILNKILPFDELTIFGAVCTIISNAVVGGIVFIFLAYKLKIISDLLGKDAIEKIVNRLTHKKKVNSN